jgi:uncharacterized membrane protein
MGPSFWLRRYLLVFAAACVIIACAQALKGHDTGYAVTQGVVWGLVTAAVYLAALYYRIRKGQKCAVCDDPRDVNTPGN